MVITGVRWAESTKRTGRKQVESCYKDKTKQYINPIIDWTDADVWAFIKGQGLKYCSLYDEGFKRLGCLLCPMAGKMRKVAAERYPKYKQAWKLAFIRLYKHKKEQGKTSVDRWKNGADMFEWWLNEKKKKVIPDQTVLFE